MKNIFKDWSKFDVLWLLVATLSTLGLSLYWGDSLLSIVSSLTGIICVILIAKRMQLNYLFGIINVVAYTIVSYNSKFYGTAMLNAFYYLPMQFIGWYMWKKAIDNNEGELESRKLTASQRINVTAITLVLVLVYGFGLQCLGNYLPYVDATTTILSIIAMILMVKRYTEQWMIWIVVNVISIVMWVLSIMNGTGDMATLLMWLVYLINSIFGLVSWLKTQKEV